MIHGIQWHPDPDQIENYDHLAETELGLMEEHLLTCASCRQLLEDADSYIAAMRAAAAELRRGELGMAASAGIHPRR